MTHHSRLEVSRERNPQLYSFQQNVDNATDNNDVNDKISVL